MWLPQCTAVWFASAWRIIIQISTRKKKNPWVSRTYIQPNYCNNITYSPEIGCTTTNNSGTIEGSACQTGGIPQGDIHTTQADPNCVIQVSVSQPDSQIQEGTQPSYRIPQCVPQGEISTPNADSHCGIGVSVSQPDSLPQAGAGASNKLTLCVPQGNIHTDWGYGQIVDVDIYVIEASVSQPNSVPQGCSQASDACIQGTRKRHLPAGNYACDLDCDWIGHSSSGLYKHKKNII